MNCRRNSGRHSRAYLLSGRGGDDGPRTGAAGRVRKRHAMRAIVRPAITRIPRIPRMTARPWCGEPMPKTGMVCAGTDEALRIAGFLPAYR